MMFFWRSSIAFRVCRGLSVTAVVETTSEQTMHTAAVNPIV